MQHKRFTNFAHQLADAAGAVIRPYFAQVKAGTLSAEAKADNSPVTAADREAEAAIRALIAAHYPEHGVFGEELGAVTSHQSPVTSKKDIENLATGDWRLATNYLWVIDPIDGTRAFLSGGQEWGTLIALCENGVPILGIFDQPITGERWVGVKGERTVYSKNATRPHPAFSFKENADLSQGRGSAVAMVADNSNVGDDNKTAPPRTSPLGEVETLLGVSGEGTCATRPCHSLADASISTTSRRYFTPPQANAFVKLAEQCGQVIEDGDCYAYGLLARGLRDVVVDAGLKPYDILALVPIIEGAGGTITGWNGAPVTLTHYANVIATGDVNLHGEVLRALSLCMTQ